MRCSSARANKSHVQLKPVNLRLPVETSQKFAAKSKRLIPILPAARSKTINEILTGARSTIYNIGRDRVISRGRHCCTLQRGRLIANITNATMFARQPPVTLQLLLTFLSCTPLRSLAHGCGRRGGASLDHQTNYAPEYSIVTHGTRYVPNG